MFFFEGTRRRTRPFTEGVNRISTSRDYRSFRGARIRKQYDVSFRNSNNCSLIFLPTESRLLIESSFLQKSERRTTGKLRIVG